MSTALFWARQPHGTHVAIPMDGDEPLDPANATSYHVEPPRTGERRQWRVYSIISGEKGKPTYHGNPHTLREAKSFCEMAYRRSQDQSEENTA